MAKLPGAAAAAETTASTEGAAPINTAGETGATNGAAPAQSAKSKSGKTKKDLGVPEENSICWIPFDLSPSANEFYAKVAAVRKTPLATLFRDVLRTVLPQYEDQFKADAAQFVPSKGGSKSKSKSVDDMSLEELEKAALTQKQRFEAAQKKAEELMAAAQARKQAQNAAAA